MLEHKIVYLEIDSKTVLKNAFSEIREEVERVASGSELTDLYNRAGYLFALAHDSFWERKFYDDIEDVHRTATDEFARTTRIINSQAEKLGMPGIFDEVWVEG